MNSRQGYRPTTLGFAIMGLLHEEPRSGYAVRRVFQETALGQYSSSPGSIYPSLRRLREEGLVRRKETKGSGGEFSLTRKGSSALRGWLQEPVDPALAPNQVQELLLRFALMGDLVGKEVKTAFLEAFRNGVESYARSLQAFMDEAGPAMPLHGRLALKHGIDGYMMDAEWASWALKQLNMSED